MNIKELVEMCQLIIDDGGDNLPVVITDGYKAAPLHSLVTTENQAIFGTYNKPTNNAIQPDQVSLTG